jgi:pimeloyl-ACP methyl ester carboxylesterase
MRQSLFWIRRCHLWKVERESGVNFEEILSEARAAQKRGYGEYITVRGVRIRYVAAGSGTPVFLLHGLGEFLETWTFNLPLLSRRYRVYALDSPGHGLSDKCESCYPLDEATRFGVDIMDAFGVRSAALIAHSLGGAVGINMAVNHPERVSQLVVVDPAGLMAKLPLFYRLASLPVWGAAMVNLIGKPLLEMGIRKLFYDPDFLSPEMLDLAWKYFDMSGRKNTLHQIIRQNANLKGVRPEAVLREKVQRLKVPTLFVHGAQDSLFPLAEVQEVVKMVPGARMAVIDRCGHCPQIEKAVEFNEVVMAFLNSD